MQNTFTKLMNNGTYWQTKAIIREQKTMFSKNRLKFWDIIPIWPAIALLLLR